MKTSLTLSRPAVPIEVEPLARDAVEIFHGPKLNALYHPRSQRVFVLDEQTTAEFAGGISPAMQTYLAGLDDAAYEADDLQRERLNRLAINVTQTCNLSCPMCYAADDGAFGTYGSGQKLLAPGIALAAFSQMCEYYPRGVSTVQFHGGEPFLHVDGIETSCEQILEESERRGIEAPVFSAISNGTCFTDRALDVIERFAIKVTVSIDGLQAQNDASRPWRGGRSTWDGIMLGLAAMEDRALAPAMIECTIGKPHADVDLVAMTRELAAKAGQNIHVAPAFVSPNSPEALTPDEEDRLMAQWDHLMADAAASLLTESPYYVQGLLSIVMALPQRTRAAHRCPAGHDTIAVDINGNVSACFMFTGQREFQMASVLDGPDETSYRDRQRDLFANGLSRPAACRGCFADGVCSDCAAGQHITRMRTMTDYTLSCRMNRSTLEHAVLLLAEAGSNTASKAQLLRNLATAPEENE